MSVNSKMTAIADSIRDKTGGTDSLTLDDMAAAIPEVYDAGYSKAESDFWDEFQNYGIRNNYEYAFHRWGKEYIRPKYKVVVSSGRTISMFSYNEKLKKIEKQYFDFSAFIPAVTATTQSNYSVFQNCTSLEEIEDVGMQAGGYYFTFNRCSSLKKIEVMRCCENGEYIAPFTNCYSLTDITIEGDIGRNISFSVSPLSIESLKSIISHLVDYAETDSEYTYTITFLTSAFQALEAEGATAEYNGTACTWAELIDNKKWNLTLA